MAWEHRGLTPWRGPGGKRGVPWTGLALGAKATPYERAIMDTVASIAEAGGPEPLSWAALAAEYSAFENDVVLIIPTTQTEWGIIIQLNRIFL